MALSKIEKYLQKNDVSFNKIVHHTTYSAQRTAADVHISGHEIAKTIIIKIDDNMTMVVVPGDMDIDLNLLKAETKANEIRLATENEFKDLFKNCEVGAMPPFGNLYKMDVIVAESLSEDIFIAFNACAHDLLIQMKYSDYEALVKPAILKIANPTS